VLGKTGTARNAGIFGVSDPPDPRNSVRILKVSASDTFPRCEIKLLKGEEFTWRHSAHGSPCRSLRVRADWYDVSSRIGMGSPHAPASPGKALKERWRTIRQCSNSGSEAP
jgi:hypothetical protein